MRLRDGVWGALVVLLGIATRIAVALLVCGGALLYQGVTARSLHGRAPRVVAWDDWVRSPRHVLAFGVVIGVNVLYIALADRLGFVIASVLYLGALFAAFGVRARLVVPLAIVVTLVIHYAFYKLLRVPLPWGWLQGIAW